ncbi:GNAT family N-acetyltransferase [Mesonia aestuariivivens]|uniref:GNAT family N-acetyltransferase n=1 Tax=Mesonia aestuariivivens TaxID=2796128 RepID=A0ABS6W195_9FLAO|nr:GNAT family N-acetyltransferase [Mesonia aestuariivivens]MBW2960928.1 GNAT family N-acetyltransferase [Mesonia aestuariivivens]
MSRIHIKKVKVEEILPVRQTVLRNGKPREECFFEGDLAKETIHLALYENEKIYAIASLLKDNNKNLTAINQYRLRGMAVMPEAQGKGLGKQLLRFAEELIKEQKNITLWFNARTTAVNFYKKNNFKILGEEFTIPKVGNHFLMFKKYE